MRNRTSLTQQAAAVARLESRIKPGIDAQPLRDAVYTLIELKKIRDECSREEANSDRVAAILADLLGCS